MDDATKEQLLDELTVEDVILWADGINSACHNELHDRVTEKEISISNVILGEAKKWVNYQE